jgi:hypothetical protein
LIGVLDQTSVAGVLCCEEVVTGILHCAAVVIEASAVQVVAIHPRPTEQSSIVSSILRTVSGRRKKKKMSEVPPKSSSGATPPVSSTVMIQSNNMSIQMTSNKLDGTNYSAWSQFVQLYVTGKGKLGYLTGQKIKSAISDPSFSTWVEENAMLMSWLLNSMTPDINASFLRPSTAYDIWDAVAQTYFTGNDASQIYELRRKAHETRQQGKSLASYFSALQTIWQELDFLNPYDMESAKDTATLKKRIENERVYDFLVGLDPGFDQIRVQVLAQDPTPNLRSTYAFVQQEELRQAVMLASPPQESSTLMTI